MKNRGRRRGKSKKNRGLSKVQRKTVARIAKNVVKNRAELKYYAQLAFSGAVGAYDNAQVSVLNAISQAEGDTAREGDQIRMTSLELRGYITGVNNFAGGRLILVMAKPGNQSLDTNASITYGLDEILYAGASSSALIDVYRNDTRFRFQILWDRTFTTKDFTAGISSSTLHFRKVMGMKQKIVQYDAGTTRITKNCLLAFWFGNATAVSGNGPTLSMMSKVRFIDC